MVLIPLRFGSKIKNNFLLVEYGKDLDNQIISEHDIVLDGGLTIRINKLKTDNFYFNIISKFGSIFNQIISALTQSLFPELSKLVAKKEINIAFNIIRNKFW